MTRLNGKVRIAVGVALLATVLGLWLTPAGTTAAGAVRPLLVRVINDSTHPVPVTGTTRIAGTPDVNVANEPTVHAQIASGSLVGIDPAHNTVQMVGSPGIPFQAELVYGNPPERVIGPTFFAVPPGERLIIEYVSGRCSGSEALTDLDWIALNTRAGGVDANHPLPAIPFASGGVVVHAFAERTMIHADEDRVSLNASAFVTSPGVVACFATISGTRVVL